MNIDKAIQTAFRFYEEGKMDDAKKICEKVLTKKPKNFNALHLLGIIYCRLGNYDNSIKYIRKALQNDPNIADAHFNLGISLKKQGQYEEAAISYKKALQLNPNFPEANCNLGIIFYEHSHYEEAITCFEKALQINPAFTDALVNLGTVYHEQGKLDKAEEYYRYALRLKPDLSTCYSNILFNMNLNAKYDPQTIFSEHLKFSKRFAEPFAFVTGLHTNERNPNRRLKVGYVSCDFRRHSVNYFFEPVLNAHNNDQFEIFCYSDVQIADDVTMRLQNYADQWRNIADVSDEKVEEMIRNDKIDILIDLAGHTAHNRLLVFARKPAPIQISWLGYPNTTGMSTIDYRLVDTFTDPVGLTDKYYTEKLIRLPQCFLCYLPDRKSPGAGDLPSIKSGFITFGSFNFFAKVSPQVIKCWAEIIKAVPNSHMVMKAKSLSDRSTREYAMDMFMQQGVAPERINLLAYAPSYRAHLDIYNRIDIGLDPFPYNGTTTTCEALWMGVPVITLAGNTHASRVGVSLLSNIGLPELIASSLDEYRNIAHRLAADRSRLKALREGLRTRMSESPLTDAERFTEKLEHCFRQVWETWCRGSR